MINKSTYREKGIMLVHIIQKYQKNYKNYKNTKRGLKSTQV